MTMTRMMKSVLLRLVGITTVSTENRLYHDHKKVKNSKKNIHNLILNWNKYINNTLK